MDIEAKHDMPPDRRQRERAMATDPRAADPHPAAQHGPILAAPAMTIGRLGDDDGDSSAPFFRAMEWLVAIALVAAVFLVYKPSWHGDFLWDDESHLLNNPVLQPGGLAKIWEPGSYLNYWPLTYTAYWVQFHLWGLRPFGFHLVNLALHAIAALLVWRVLVRLQVPGALFAAALFALHPVNVETAAWIAHLKDILSLTLALASMLFYLDSERHESRWRYGLAVALFALSALAKGTAVMLPVVLLACAWWQRGRIGWRDLLRVVPYFLIGGVMAGVEVWTQHTVALGETIRSDGIFSRLAVAGCAVWFYLGKLLLPIHLCPVYPRWTIDGQSVISYLPGLMWLAVLAVAWWQRRTWGRPVVMLMVCYTALLLPVLGFANIYFMRYSLVSDHWQYIATIVPCAVFAGVTTTFARRMLVWPAAVAAATGLLVVLGVLSLLQSRIYVDNEHLYEAILARNPDCWMVHSNLGVILQKNGETDSAIDHYHKALALNPDYPEAYNNLGEALLARKQYDSAIESLRRALEIRPKYAEAHNNLALGLVGRGEIDSAISHLQRAVEINPNYAEAHNNLAVELLTRGQVDAGIAHLQKAIQLAPDDFQAYNNLARVLLSHGQFDLAIAYYQKVLTLKPDFADARNNLALAMSSRGQVDAAISRYQETLSAHPDDAEAQFSLAKLLGGRGQLEAAIPHYQKAVEIKPAFAEAHYELANALLSRRDLDGAIEQFQKALETRPNYAEAHYSLGNALLSHGLINSAIEHYQKALDTNPNYVEAHDNLAAALAKGEDFDSAIVHYQKALEIKPDNQLARKNLAIVRAELERIVKAVAEQRAAMQFRPNDASLLSSMAWTLATNPNASVRNGAEAVELAERASKLSGGNDPAMLATLAAAYAEAGQFPKAVRTEEQAEDLASTAGNQSLVEQIHSRLELYKSQKPFRQVPSR